MSSPGCRKHAVIAIGLALLWAPLALPSTASTEPRTGNEAIEREMTRIRANIKNASIRLENQVQGIGSGEPGEPSTPATDCCSNNLRKINDAAGKLDALLVDLSACHQQTEDPFAPAVFEAARRDLSVLVRVVDLLAQALSPEETQGAMGALTRAFLGLRASVDRLPVCASEQSLPDTEVAPSETGKTKKKKAKQTGSEKSG